MMILLSQLFSPATLLARALLAPVGERSARLVLTRSPDASFAPAGSALLETIFGLPPMREERPYAL